MRLFKKKHDDVVYKIFHYDSKPRFASSIVLTDKGVYHKLKLRHLIDDTVINGRLVTTRFLLMFSSGTSILEKKTGGLNIAEILQKTSVVRSLNGLNCHV